jgi:hypothetical protein
MVQTTSSFSAPGRVVKLLFEFFADPQILLLDGYHSSGRLLKPDIRARSVRLEGGSLDR